MNIDLLLDETGHIACYMLFITPVIFLWKKAFTHQNFLIGFFISVFLDIDHLFEYLIHVYKTQATFNFHIFLSGNYFARGTTVVLFHGWEYVLLLLLLFILAKNKQKASWLLFVVIGLCAHITFDMLSYGFTPQVYSVIYRAYNSFSSAIFERRLLFLR